ncbi:hypothetical protein NMY22_g11750 [Coprinellus aureogranulatus]|nr:hypothetical protein NMY22_g11750 [Coprinellus aureogranulatus]
MVDSPLPCTLPTSREPRHYCRPSPPLDDSGRWVTQPTGVIQPPPFTPAPIVALSYFSLSFGYTCPSLAPLLSRRVKDHPKLFWINCRESMGRQIKSTIFVISFELKHSYDLPMLSALPSCVVPGQRSLTGTTCTQHRRQFNGPLQPRPVVDLGAKEATNSVLTQGSPSGRSDHRSEHQGGRGQTSHSYVIPLLP